MSVATPGARRIAQLDGRRAWTRAKLAIAVCIAVWSLGLPLGVSVISIPVGSHVAYALLLFLLGPWLLMLVALVLVMIFLVREPKQGPATATAARSTGMGS